MACEACGAEKGHLYQCPVGEAAMGITSRAAEAAFEADDDERFEWYVRLFALPAALAVATLVHLTGFGSGLSRLIAGMWLHEFGHAVAAWFTGHSAVPLPWVTSVFERGWFISLALVAGLGLLAFGLFKRERPGLAALAGAFALLGVLGRWVPETSARTFIDWAGDGVGMMLATVTMLAVFARPGTRLHHGALRWGFLGLGALAFVDMFSVWVASWKDPAEIPFGQQDYAGLSDPSRLVDVAGWTEAQLVHRYLATGGACLAVLAGCWGLFVWAQRQRLSG
jgi:hypothetical protein